MERFDNAVRKLYTAFHEGTLNAFDCKACAVGNIVGHGDWSGCIAVANEGGLGDLLEYIYLSRKEVWIGDQENNSGYSKAVLLEIEKIFLGAHIGRSSDERTEVQQRYNKDAQYNGLIAVVKYLAELDGIEWPDYTKLFEYNEQGAVYEL